jgi:TolB-like protein/tetratricopeptide (TPR) repeat protein
MFGSKAGPAVGSVAVLPFENQGPADEAYFADGIVDEVREKLARLNKFTVIAAASANQYRDTDKIATQIADELHVQHLLTGRVRWAVAADGTKRVKVTTELVDGATGKVTWTDSFDGDMSDPFAIQGRIATRVAGALGVALTPQNQQNLSGRSTDNPEAYELFLKARAVIGDSPMASRARSVLLEQAIALDSNFPHAWGFLSSSQSTLYANGTREPAAAKRAKEALDRLMALVPDSANAHMVARNYYLNVARDQEAARRSVARALELDPNNLNALNAAAQDDLNAGNYQATFTKLSRAREIDPLSRGVLANLIRAQLFIGQHQEARATAEELTALEPTSYNAMQLIALAHVAAGDSAGARRVIQEFLKRMPATELVAYFAGYQEMAYLLSDADRALLFRMTPAAFDDDRAWWGQALATAAMQQGDVARARAYADSSLVIAQEQINGAPNDAQLRMINAVMLGYLGRNADAKREMEMAIADTVGQDSESISYELLQYVRALVAIGEREQAIDKLEILMQRQYWTSPALLRTDPLYRPLHGNPRFERLANRGIGAPVD